MLSTRRCLRVCARRCDRSLKPYVESRVGLKDICPYICPSTDAGQTEPPEQFVTLHPLKTVLEVDVVRLDHLLGDEDAYPQPNPEDYTNRGSIITPLRDRWTVKIKRGPDLDVQGNILDHEYRIGEGRQKVGEVSKKWFRVRDTYGVEIAEGQDDAVILAVTVAIDMMAHPTR